MSDQDKTTQTNREISGTQWDLEEANTGITFTSTVGMVVFFFIGLLITGGGEVHQQLRIPLYFLFLSAYGFLFATILYANSTSRSTREEVEKGDRNRLVSHNVLGDLLSELPGIFLLIFSIPIVLLRYSPDIVLPVLLLISGDLALYLYHHLGYDLLEEYMPAAATKRIMLELIAIHTFLFLFKFYGYHPGAYFAAGVLILGILGLFVHCCLASNIRLNMTHKTSRH